MKGELEPIDVLLALLAWYGDTLAYAGLCWRRSISRGKHRNLVGILRSLSRRYCERSRLPLGTLGSSPYQKWFSSSPDWSFLENRDPREVRDALLSDPDICLQLRRIRGGYYF